VKALTEQQTQGDHALPDAETDPAAGHLLDVQPLVPGNESLLWQAAGTAQRAGLRAASRGEGRSMLLQSRTYDFASEFHAGDVIAMPLMDGEQAVGTINLVQRDEGGWVRVGGDVAHPEAGTFYLASNGNEIYAMILLSERQLAYKVEPQEQGGLQLKELPLSEVVCNQTYEDESPIMEADSNGIAVPILSSRPEALAVLYLDFDGETVTDPIWNGGNTIHAKPLSLTLAEIVSIWRTVAEDFSPFNIDVTTDENRYTTAPVGRRMRCIITSTKSWYGNAAGVAYVNSFSTAGGGFFSSTIPCWSFTSSPRTISHELGHTLGLRHDGLTTPPTEYYTGHGSGTVSWGPIMGSGNSRALTQWSKGEYRYANRDEDDIAIIANDTNGFGYVPDEAGNTRQTAAPLTHFGPHINQTGIISHQNDMDFYQFTIPGGDVTISADPNPTGPNLDLLIELQDASGNVLASDNPDLDIKALITLTDLSAGTYYLKVQGTGRGDPLGDGYTSYGSVGQYQISGTIPSTAPLGFIGLERNGNRLINGYSKSQIGTKSLDGVSIPSTFVIRNRGNAPLSGLTAEVTGPAASNFTVGPLGNTTLAPNETTTFDVQFTPLEVGVFTVNLRVKSAPGQSPDFVSQMIAEGILPEGIPEVVSFTGPQVLEIGQPATLSVITNGALPQTYQWLKNSNVIPGQSESTLTIPSLKASDAGSYSVLVGNSTGSFAFPIGSSILCVIDLPPAVVSVKEGGSVTLTAKIHRPANVSLTSTTWRRDDHWGIWSSKPTLKLSQITPERVGNYVFSMRFSGPRGTFRADSRPILLQIVPRPVLDDILLPDVFVSQEVSATITAANFPREFSAKNLPPGVRLNAASGELTGRPTAARIVRGQVEPYEVTFNASNAAGNATEAKRVSWLVKPLPEGIAGRFDGLVDPHPDINDQFGGTLSLSIRPSGSLSGKLKLGARTHRFKTSLKIPTAGGPAAAEFDIPRKSPLPPLTLTLTTQPQDNRIAASIKIDADTLCNAQIYRAIWNKNHPAADYVGYGTAALLPPGLVLTDASAYPQGGGFLTLSVKQSGAASWRARLADGTGIAGRTPLGPAGQLPVHQMLYRKTGSIQGWQSLTPISRQLDGDLTWRKASQGVTKNRSYTGGIPQHQLQLIGGPYDPSSPPLLSYSAAQLRFQHGAMDSPLLVPVTITDQGTTRVISSASTVKISLKPASGLFSGTLILEGSMGRSGKFQGAIVPRLDAGTGFHLLSKLPESEGESLRTTPIQSGLVDLQPEE
jgi:hypothetical protein